MAHNLRARLEKIGEQRRFEHLRASGEHRRKASQVQNGNLQKKNEIEFLPRKYIEDESFLCYGYPEPHVRRQEVIFRSSSSKWHINITFTCEALQRLFSGIEPDDSCIFASEPIKKRLERREEFQSFILYLNFSQLKLLPNNVTEVALLLESAESTSSNLDLLGLIPNQSFPVVLRNRFFKIAYRLRVSTREDPLRIVYPPYVEDTSWPETRESDVQKELDINGSAFRVKRAGETTSYIYKIVDRPFYNCGDTEIFLQELHNLKLFRDDPNIVQLRSVVVSANPYQTTTQDNDSLVIRGFLLEYHPYGTLEERLDQLNLDQVNLAKYPWKGWPLQIGYGLLHLHQANITHMDLKPSNIVISICGNALLIDIGGIGGVTPEWMAPEMQNKDYRRVSFEERKLNDMWAYGRVLSAIARTFDGRVDVGWLHEVAADTTQEDPQMRLDLPNAISKLQSAGKDAEVN